MFTIDELSIIKMYSGFNPDRDTTISAMNDILPFIDEPEIIETVKSAIRKVNAMTNEAFFHLNLTNILEEE